MADKKFNLYLLFIMSWFLHIPARVPVLSLVRFDLILIAVLLFLISQDRSEQDNEKFDSVGKILFVLLVYVVVTTPFVRWPGSVINTGIPNLIKAVIFYYMTVSIITTERKLKIFIFIVLACQTFRVLEPLYLHLVHGYWGSQTYMGEGSMMSRLAGGPHDIINPNGLAFVIVSIIPFYHYLCLPLSFKFKLLYAVLLPLFIYAMILSASRSGFLALGIILISIFIKSHKKALLVPILILSAVIVFANLSDIQKDRYFSIYKSDVRGAGTTKTRTDTLIRDFKLGLKKPIVGHGLGTSREANYHEYGTALLAHNLWAEIMIEIGLPGLAIFLLLVRRIILNFRNSLREIRGRIHANEYISRISNSLQVWLIMNIFFSFASYGLSSYEWYLFGGLSVVILRLIHQKIDMETGL